VQSVRFFYGRVIERDLREQRLKALDREEYVASRSLSQSYDCRSTRHGFEGP
jgi:hypothetical protein